MKIMPDGDHAKYIFMNCNIVYGNHKCYVCVCVYVHVYICMYVCLCVYIYTHISMFGATPETHSIDGDLACRIFAGTLCAGKTNF
jgi:hypothetical protein